MAVKSERLFVQKNVALDSTTKLQILGDTMSDSSGKTVSASGTAAVTTAQYKFAEIGRSIVFDGNSDYLTVADSADWDFGTGDFTIDFWVRFSDITPGQMFFNRYVDNSNRVQIAWNGDSKLQMYFNVGGSGRGNYQSDAWTPTINTWYHIAFVRNGSTALIFINGVSQTVTEGAAFGDISDIASDLYIGVNIQTPGSYVNGHMSCIRINKGAALWTSGFTVPVYSDYKGSRTIVVIPNLNGDTDEEYELRCRFVNSIASACYYHIYPNNDTTSSNFGLQILYAINTAYTADRSTAAAGVYLTYAQASDSGKLVQCKTDIFAKSGALRTFLNRSIEKVSATTVSAVHISSSAWNNTADNLTSLVISADQINGLGPGSIIELYRKATV